MKSALPAQAAPAESSDIVAKYGDAIAKYKEKGVRAGSIEELRALNKQLSDDLELYERDVGDLQAEVDVKTEEFEKLSRESERLIAALEKKRRRLGRDREFDSFVKSVKNIESKRAGILKSIGCEGKILKSRNDLLESIRFMDEFNKELTSQIELLGYIMDASHSLSEKKKEVGRKILEKDREMEKLTEAIMKINKESAQLETKIEKKRRNKTSPISPTLLKDQASAQRNRTEKRVVKPVLGEKRISKSDYDAARGGRPLAGTLPGLMLPMLKPLDEEVKMESSSRSRSKSKRKSDSEASTPNLSATLTDLNALLFKIADDLMPDKKAMGKTTKTPSPVKNRRQGSPFMKTFPTLNASPMRLSSVGEDSEIDAYAYVKTNGLIQQEIEDKIVLKKLQKQLNERKAERNSLKAQLEMSTPKLALSDKFGFSILEDPLCQTGRGFGQRVVATQTDQTGDMIDFHMHVLKEQEVDRDESHKLKKEIEALEEQARNLTSQILATGIEGKRIEVQIGKIESVLESVKGNTETNISLRAVVGADIDENMAKLKADIEKKSEQLEEFVEKTREAEILLRALTDQKAELEMEVYEMTEGEDPQIRGLQSELELFDSKRKDAQQRELKAQEDLIRKKEVIDDMRASEGRQRYRKLMLRKINLERRIQKWKMLLQDTKDSIQILEQFSTDKRDRRQSLRDAVERGEQMKFDKEEELSEIDGYRQLLEDLLKEHQLNWT